MKIRELKFLTVAAVVALGLGLAGCGGGGGGTAEVPPPVTPDPDPTPAEQLAAAQKAVSDAQAAIDAATTPAEISAAYAALATAQAQLTAAQSIPANQMAALQEQLNQIRASLQAAEMLASQRDTVGQALIAAQNAVSALSATSSDADAMAAGALVMAAETALTAATALPDDDALRTSVAAVRTAFDDAQMDRTIHMQQGDVNAALMAARMAVDGLSNASTDDDVAAARTAVMAAQTALTAATALPDDDPLRAMVATVDTDLNTAVTMRTAHMETGNIESLISDAMDAVGGLDRVTSSVQAVSDANTAVQAAAAAIAAATALTEEQRTALTNKLAADAGDDLTTITEFRGTPAGSLQVAQAAVMHAEGLVDALTNDSSPEDARAAYQAMADAQAALREAEAHPDNQIASLRAQLGRLQDQLDDAGTADGERNAVTMALNEANEAIAALDGATSTQDDVDAARAKITEAQNALNGATKLSDAEKSGLQSLIDTASSTLDPIATMVAERPDPTVVAANTKAAGTMEKEIKAEADQNTDAGLGGSSVTATGNDEGAYNLAIKRDRDGTTVTVTVEGATDDDDEKFMQAMDLGSGSTMHTRTMEADGEGDVVQETVIVTTDIEAPKATAFGKVHTLDVRVDGETATDEDPNDALNVAAAGLSHVKAGTFTAPAGTVGTTVLSFQHAVDDDESTTDVDESRDAAEIAGTYEGASGVYKCNAAVACTVTVDAKGVVSAVSADDAWIFIPASDATIDVADADYLNYGVWRKKTTDEDGVVEYNEVETFAGSSIAASGDVSAVLGKATYEGGATGVYVHTVTKPDGTRESATSGHFSADASLTATFGQVPVSDTDTTGTIAPNLLSTLTGTIDDFDLSGHDEGPGWSVTLQGDITESAGTASGTAKGGGADDGSFTATFHGDVTAAADGSVPQPGSVVGEFNSFFSNGSVAGAFGARKQD